MPAAYAQHTFVENKIMTAQSLQCPHIELKCSTTNTARYTSFFCRSNVAGQLLLKWLYCFIFFCIALMQQKVHAQLYENLQPLKGYRTVTYFSAGSELKAARMAKQLDAVTAFYTKQIQFTPSVTLLILSPEDWSKYTKFPVYGMPHYTDSKTLIVAANDNDFWKSFIPPLDKLPKEYAQLIKETYLNKNGELSMEPFFDLLAIHELGHAYHIQGGLVMQRKWMGELFCNILLHGYIAENEPNLLPALTLFPKMVVETTDRTLLKYSTVEDLETHYNDLGQKYPQNYGWYQCRWHMSAGKIYDAGSILVFQNLWGTLKSQREVLSDTALITIWNQKVHKSIADMQMGWNKTE